MHSQQFFQLWNDLDCDRIVAREIRKHADTPIFDDGDVSAIMLFAHDHRANYDPDRSTTSEHHSFQSFVFFQAKHYLRNKRIQHSLKTGQTASGRTWREQTLSDLERLDTTDALPSALVAEIELPEANPFDQLKAVFLSLIDDWKHSERAVERRYAQLAEAMTTFHDRKNYLPSAVQLSEQTGVQYETVVKDVRHILRRFREVQAVAQVSGG